MHFCQIDKPLSLKKKTKPQTAWHNLLYVAFFIQFNRTILALKKQNTKLVLKIFSTPRDLH